MKKLPEVQDAKALMQEARTWSVMKWLREKKRVRAAADQANAALDALRQQVQNTWPEELQSAYIAGAAKRTGHNGSDIRPDKLKHLWEADQRASQARELAEKTFNDAEKQLSTRLAREGCEKAVQSWELHEIAIDQAAVLARTRQ